MMMDRENTFTGNPGPQTVAANGNSTDYIDMLAAKNLGGGNEMLKLVATLKAKAGTTPTLRIVLVGADDVAFSVNKITIADSGTLTDPPLGTVRFGIPSHLAKRYFRLEFTVGGTGPSFDVDAGLVINEQTSGFLA